MKIILILARLKKYFELLDVDKNRIENILFAIEKIEKSLLNLSQISAKDILVDNKDFTKICKSWGK